MQRSRNLSSRMPELVTSGSDGGPGRATAQVHPTRGQRCARSPH
jgi:hypothetical protein